MDDTKAAWSAVGDHLSALLLKLKLHAEEELADTDVREREGLDRLKVAFDEAVEAIGDAYNDQAVRDDARRVGQSFVAAIDATVSEAKARVPKG